MIWNLANVLLVVINKAFRTQYTAGPLGCRSNPVRCYGPAGEQSYLDRLRGPGGQRILYKRAGSLLLPSPFGNIVDLYRCKNGRTSRCIYMDMYHKEYMETRPVSGLTLAPVVDDSSTIDGDGE